LFKSILRVAATLKPEKLLALLLKLRKSSVGSLKVKDILPALDHLGGWKVYQESRAYAQGGKLYGVDEPVSYGSKNESTAQQKWEEAKRLERSSVPVELRVGEEAYMDVSPLAWDGEYWRFTYRKWVGADHIIIRSPRGREFSRAFQGSSYLNEYIGNTIFSFLVEEGLLNQVNEALGTSSLEYEKAEKAKNAPKKGNTGTCPVCFRRQKLAPKSKFGSDRSRPGMVLHGYERPGFGFIDGNCSGVGWPPFELSSEGTESMIPFLTRQIHTTESGPLLSDPDSVTSLVDKYNVRKLHLKADTDPSHWEQLLKSAVSKAKESLEGLTSLKKELEGKIRSWKPAELG
jgi:hypothetical protein